MVKKGTYSSLGLCFSIDRTIKGVIERVAWPRQGFRFRCGAHLVNLALGSSEKVLRSRGTNFVLERSHFDEVWVPKQALDAAPDALWACLVVLTWVSVPGCLGLGTGRTHRTHRGVSDPLLREVCKLDRAPDTRTEPTVVRPVPYPERVAVYPLTGHWHWTHYACVQCTISRSTASH